MLAAPPVIRDYKATSAITAPPCLIMLGGLGDLLITLPIAWHYAQRFGQPTPVLTSARYQNVLSGCSYVKSVGYGDGAWRHYTESIEWARARFSTVYPLHVGDAEIRDNPKRTRFCHEQYLHAGVDGRYGEFPLIFDRRDKEREKSVVNRVRNGLPMLLYNFEGRSSPFSESAELLESITQRWGSKIQFVNISKLDLSHYQDLLGLLDASIGMISIDTSTLHLMPASKTPYIALCNDTKTPWYSSVPRGNCVMELGYTQAAVALPMIHEVIEDMVTGKPVEPHSPALIRSFAKTNNASVKASRNAKPHIFTLACNGMESVQATGARLWNQWLRAHSLEMEVIRKAPRQDLHPSWNRIPLMIAALEKHEVVWSIDSDIVPARLSSSLPWSDSDLLFSTDWNGLCCGIFRAKATEWTKAFLRAVLFLGDVCNPDEFGKGCGVKYEQNAIKALLRDFPSCAARVSFLPRSFVTDTDFTNTSFAFHHFGCMSNKSRIDAIRKKPDLH